MRVQLSAQRTALLAYCANVHPGETLDDVLAMTARFAGPVRRELEVEALGLGLWISRRALDELRREGTGRLSSALEREDLFCFTLNGFPYGNFHSDVVKRAVYHPDLSTPERTAYLVGLAELIAEIAPPDIDELTISTLPLGHRDEAAPDLRERSLERLLEICEQLARLRDRTGRSVRICLEPEPGCLLERTRDAVQLFAEELPKAARRRGTPGDLVFDHLGVCFDTCHQAVAFEDAGASLFALREAGVRVGKMQLSSALSVPDPVAAAATLAKFDEPRFLHQVRALLDDGALAAADDLGFCEELPRDREWRVHFHVPIHRELVGELGTTREFLSQALEVALKSEVVPHLEVETYTWSVLPERERPADDAGLVRGIARELAWVRERIK